MKTYKIALQDGLDAVKSLLVEKGHEVVPYGDANADIAIVTGVSAEYEEMETAQCMLRGEGEMLVLNASGMTPDQVLKYVENNQCK